MTESSFKQTLKGALYHTVPAAKYPFYLVQLSADKELDLNGHFVSDALAWLLSQNEYTHVFLQTHGWNTAPDKAIKVPFSQFMSGMQDDHTMPSDPSFKPIFIAFTWEALPLKFMLEEDALTRTELLGPAMRECGIEDPTLTDAAEAVSSAARGGPPEGVRDPLKKLKDKGRLGIDESEADDVNTDALVDKALAASVAEPTSAEEERSGFPGFGFIRQLVNPLQRLVFGRLIERGVRTGEVLHDIIAKFMRARRAKYCIMANSLGVHVIAGALLNRGELPFRMHTVFFVQGACNRDWFGPTGRYRSLAEQVAGPVVCTLSKKDTVLTHAFEPFHGDAIGTFGFTTGAKMNMRDKGETARNPYPWNCGDWNSIDGTRFIDEGHPLAGGSHGDFKEDQTTMTYWSAINVNMDDDKYNFPAGSLQEKIGGFLDKVIGATPLGKLFG